MFVHVSFLEIGGPSDCAVYILFTIFHLHLFTELEIILIRPLYVESHRCEIFSLK